MTPLTSKLIISVKMASKDAGSVGSCRAACRATCCGASTYFHDLYRARERLFSDEPLLEIFLWC